MKRRAPRAPSPPGLPLAGHALAFRRDPLGFLRSAAARCGPIARLHAGPLVYHLVSDPALIADVLQRRASEFVRDTRSSRTMKLVTGESLLSTSGEAWRRHRRLAQPIFHPQRLAGLAAITTEACVEAGARWERAAREDTPLELVAEMSRLTFSIVGRCLFSAELGARTEDVERAYGVLLDELFRRSRAIVTLPLWVPTRGHRRFRQALAGIDAVVAEILQRRRRDAQEHDDLVGVLLQARDDTGAPLGDDEIRNHAITFLLAGHETTASVLTWAWCLLDRDPAARDAVDSELATVLGGRPPRLEDLSRLPRLEAVVQETLRLYPAIWVTERRAVTATELGGHALPRNSSVLVSAAVTQRLARQWPEPDAFLPERFSAGALPGVEAGFLPFGAGPHHCIGQHFALLEIRLILATLLARFRVRLAGAMPEAEAGITLRPAAAVAARVERLRR